MTSPWWIPKRPKWGNQSTPTRAWPATGRTRAARRRAAPNARVVTVPIATERGEVLPGPLDRMDDFAVSFRDGSGNYRTVRRTPGTRVVKNDPFAAHVALLSRITDQNIHDVVAYL